MSVPPIYLSAQNSAEERMYEMNLNKNYSIPAPTDFNNFRHIPRAADNAVYEVDPSVSFKLEPNVAIFPSLPPPPPYQINQNINNGFAAVEKLRQHMPAAPPSMYMYNRPQPPPYPDQFKQNFGPVRQNEARVIRKPKRIRTAFTTSQITALEQEYAAKKYLDTKRRHDLAAVLQLKDRAIKIWFQNRRMKEKKERFEEAEEVIENVSTTANPVGPGAPVYQSPYYRQFNSKIAGAYTSAAIPRPEVGEVNCGGYSAPGMAAQCPPPSYDQVMAQGYMSQQSVATSPQNFELIQEPAQQQQETMLANNQNGLVEVNSADRILDLSWIDSLFIDNA